VLIRPPVPTIRDMGRVLRHLAAFAVLLGFGFAFGWYGGSEPDRLLEQAYDCTTRCEARCGADDDDVGIALGVDRARCSDCDCR
jgi:hypothetical protein